MSSFVKHNGVYVPKDLLEANPDSFLANPMQGRWSKLQRRHNELYEGTGGYEKVRGVPYPIAGGSAFTYIVYNSAMATTAAPVKQPTGTSIRTMMELAPAPNWGIRIIEWGCSFDASTAAVPGEVELVDTGTVFVNTITTAYGVNDIQPYGNAKAPANTSGTGGVPLNLGTSLSGFATAAATGEGSITATRNGDLQLLPPTAPYLKQWPLGREFDVPPSDALRGRVTFGSTVNMYMYMIFET